MWIRTVSYTHLSESEQEEVIDSAGDTAKGDTMETNKKTTPILPPDIQRMIDEIEGIIPPEEEKKEPTGVYLKRKEEPSENMGQVCLLYTSKHHLH